MLAASSLALATPAHVDEYIKNIGSGMQTGIEDHILEFKTYRNSLVPVGRLPPEVLAGIFSHLVRLYGDRALRKNERQWLNVTFVCRAWRWVALNSPRVWSYFSFGHDDYDRVTTFLERSCSAPLTLKQRDARSCPSDRMLHAIFKVLYRVQEITFRLWPKYVEFAKAENLTFDAPCLRKATIDTVPMLYQRTSLPTLANAHWPRLTNLDCVCRSSSVLQALVRPTLTNLRVRGTSGGGIPAVNWIDVLRGLKSLINLTIDTVVAPPMVPLHMAPKPVRKATLPQLRHLHIVDMGDGTACADLINHLAVPVGAGLYLQMQKRRSREALEFVFGALARMASGSDMRVHEEPPPVLAVCLEIWPPHGLLVEIHHSDVSVKTTKSDDGPEIPAYFDEKPRHKFILGCDGDGDGDNGITDIQTQAFAMLYPLSHVRTLALQGGIVTEVETWLVFSRQLPNLVELEIANNQDGVETFFRHTTEHPAAFPMLTWLVFDGITWNTQRFRSQCEHDARVGSLMVKLIQFVETRAASGMRLQRLAIDFGKNLDREHGLHQDLLRLYAAVDEVRLHPDAEE